MTNEELQQTVDEHNADLETLSDPEKKLTKEENGRKRLLLMKKDTLERVKLAREKQNFNEEVKLLTSYGLLESLGGKHPFLLYFLQNKFRGSIF